MINPIKPFKPVIYDYKPLDTRKLCSFVVPESKIGKLKFDIIEDPQAEGYKFFSQLKDSAGDVLGHEHFAMFEDSDHISGLYIATKQDLRKKGTGIGEVLRLGSIIEMLENGIKKLDIVSKDSAIFFHSKYKFEPAVTIFDERNRLLKCVAQDTAFEDLSKEAQNLLDKIANTHSGKEQRILSEDANKLLAAYTRQVLAEKNQAVLANPEDAKEIAADMYKKHSLAWTMQMTLTDEKILENRDFFNSLFQKHGIDYSI